MVKFQKLGRELVLEGEALQDFVQQQHDYERAEHAAERDLESDRCETEKEKIAVEKEKNAAEKEKLADRLAKQCEIELARVAAEEANKQRQVESAK